MSSLEFLWVPFGSIGLFGVSFGVLLGSFGFPRVPIFSHCRQRGTEWVFSLIVKYVEFLLADSVVHDHSEYIISVRLIPL